MLCLLSVEVREEEEEERGEEEGDRPLSSVERSKHCLEYLLPRDRYRAASSLRLAVPDATVMASPAVQASTDVVDAGR